MINTVRGVIEEVICSTDAITLRIRLESSDREKLRIGPTIARVKITTELLHKWNESAHTLPGQIISLRHWKENNKDTFFDPTIIRSHRAQARLPSAQKTSRVQRFGIPFVGAVFGAFLTFLGSWRQSPKKKSTSPPTDRH